MELSIRNSGSNISGPKLKFNFSNNTRSSIPTAECCISPRSFQEASENLPWTRCRDLRGSLKFARLGTPALENKRQHLHFLGACPLGMTGTPLAQKRTAKNVLMSRYLYQRVLMSCCQVRAQPPLLRFYYDTRVFSLGQLLSLCPPCFRQEGRALFNAPDYLKKASSRCY